MVNFCNVSPFGTSLIGEYRTKVAKVKLRGDSCFCNHAVPHCLSGRWPSSAGTSVRLSPPALTMPWWLQSYLVVEGMQKGNNVG